MGYTWYLDTFLLTACLVDFIAFLLAGYMVKKQMLLGRCMVCSALSATAEALFYIVLPSYILYRVIVLFILNPLVIKILLRPRKIKDFFSGYLLVFAILLLIGGFQMLFLYWIDIKHGIGIWQAVLALLVCLFIIYIKCRTRESEKRYTVVLCHGKEKVHLNAILDTGNFLRDPYSGRPVSIVEKEALRELHFEGADYRYIPFHTVGKEHGILPVITLDRMILKQGETIYERSRPVIGVADGRLFKNGDIQMILHNEIV